MNDDFRQLLAAARQIIQADQMLSGDLSAPGKTLREPVVASPAATAAAPARSASRHFDVPPAPAIAPGEKQRLLAEVEQQVRQCRRCGLCQQRTNVVFGEGNPDAKLVFVGEAPGEEEDRQGRPFVGKAGEMLTKQIHAMGLKREDVYIANVCKCRPPGNRTPIADEAEHCREHLIAQLRIIRPKVIVALGNPATHALLNTTIGITRLRGQWQRVPEMDPELAGIKVMPTFHPAYLLRSYTEDNRRKVWSDLQAVMKELGPKK